MSVAGILPINYLQFNHSGAGAQPHLALVPMHDTAVALGEKRRPAGRLPFGVLLGDAGGSIPAPPFPRPIRSRVTTAAFLVQISSGSFGW